jgi:3-isopropylmalate/(R)-2-methylmalate dehydratase small subunit
MKSFAGNILFLDRTDINTDEIIPAKYLNEITKAAMQPHLLEDLKLDGFDPARDIAGKGVLVSRRNFGCGSSREHAVWALETNGINLVLAPGFARIFRQNMYNCGMIALELPEADIDLLFTTFAKAGAAAELDLAGGSLLVRAGKTERRHRFELGEFERGLVTAGGWVEFADSRY